MRAATPRHAESGPPCRAGRHQAAHGSGPDVATGRCRHGGAPGGVDDGQGKGSMDGKEGGSREEVMDPVLQHANELPPNLQRQYSMQASLRAAVNYMTGIRCRVGDKASLHTADPGECTDK